MEKFKNVKELEKFYKKFEGKSLSELRELVSKKYPKIILKTNKGIVGQVLESLIGSSPNNDPNPDVKGINVELKVLPLRKVGEKIQPKERSKIKSINYNTLVEQEWHTSDVKHKMNKMLFLLYEQPTGKTYKDWNDFRFMGTMLYELDKESPEVVKEDWTGIHYKVKSEIADEISEGDSKILGACTSGSGKYIKYGNNKEAKQRSYSLKHNYLKVFYREQKKKHKYFSLNLDKDIEPQDYVLNILKNELEGENLEKVVDKFKVNFSTKAKSSFPLLLNRALKVDDNKDIRELEENGIIIKTVPVNLDMKPWEAMSFPKFSLVDLIYEDWDNSIFKQLITQGFILVPVIKEKYKPEDSSNLKFKDWTTWKIGIPVFWKACKSEIAIIKKEWQQAKKIVEDGINVWLVQNGKKTIQKNNLLKSKNTDIIHIRPHARDSSDLDKPYAEYTNSEIEICWQSFWLNKNFVEEVLKR